MGRLAAERPRSMADGLIAATAAIHDKNIVTRNVDDFRRHPYSGYQSLGAMIAGGYEI
jgi:predicted nucleic acid-binding protein